MAYFSRFIITFFLVIGLGAELLSNLVYGAQAAFLFD